MPRKPPPPAPFGNKRALGNPGPGTRHRLVTSVIIAKLNEVDPHGGRANVFKLVDELFEQATAREVPVLDANGKPKRGKDGKVQTVRVLGDLAAKKEIIDRADGKSVQGMSFEGDGKGKVTMIFEKDDERV